MNMDQSAAFSAPSAFLFFFFLKRTLQHHRPAFPLLTLLHFALSLFNTCEIALSGKNKK